MLGKGDLRDCGPGNKTPLFTITALFPSPRLPHLCKVQLHSGLSWGLCTSSLGAPWSEWAQESPAEGGSGGGPGQGWCGGSGWLRATPFSSGCWAERSWTLGNDLKGTGNRAGYLELKKVSQNLPLLLSSPTQTSCLSNALSSCLQLCPSLLPRLSLDEDRGSGRAVGRGSRLRRV